MKKLLAVVIAAMLALSLTACDSHPPQQPAPTAQMVQQCGVNPKSNETECVMVPQAMVQQHAGSSDNSWIWGLAGGYMLGNMINGHRTYQYQPPATTTVSKTTIVNNYGSPPSGSNYGQTQPTTTQPASAQTKPIDLAKPAAASPPTQRANSQPTALFAPTTQKAPTGGTLSKPVAVVQSKPATVYTPPKNTSGPPPRALFSGSSSSSRSSSSGRR